MNSGNVVNSFISYKKLVPSIMSRRMFSRYNQKGTLEIINPTGKPGKHNEHIVIESLPPQYKKAVEELLTETKEDKITAKIRAMILPDPKLRTYYETYIMPNGRYMKPATAHAMYERAVLVRMCAGIMDHGEALRHELDTNMPSIWDAVLGIITTNRAIHKLPTSYRRLQDWISRWRTDGPEGMIDHKQGNAYRQKVNVYTESLVLALYKNPIKSTAANVARQFEAFMSGTNTVLNKITGELIEPIDYHAKGVPMSISCTSVKRILDKPDNRAILLGGRMSWKQYQDAHGAYYRRADPVHALSVISLDDISVPFVMPNGVRPSAYFVFDVASQAIIGWAMQKTGAASVPLIRSAIADAFGNIYRHGWKLPYEVEVEQHLTSDMEGSRTTPDVLREGTVFANVRKCAARNPQEKRAERFINYFKRDLAKYEGFQKRPFARRESNRINPDAETSQMRYEYEAIENIMTQCVEAYNNTTHPKKDKYPDMTRIQILASTQSDQLYDTVWRSLLPYVGYHTETSIHRKYVRVQGMDMRFEQIDDLERLRHKRLVACWLPDADGNIDRTSVHVYDVESDHGKVLPANYIGKLATIIAYNDSKLEQTEADRQSYQDQSKYIMGTRRRDHVRNESIDEMAVIDTPIPQPAGRDRSMYREDLIGTSDTDIVQPIEEIPEEQPVDTDIDWEQRAIDMI